VKTPKTTDDGKFKIYWLTFRMPVMGDENILGPETRMAVSTQGGPKDAIEACRKYHRGCKIVCVQDRIQAAAGIKVPVDKIPEQKKAWPGGGA
jgi:hypothetical protein